MNKKNKTYTVMIIPDRNGSKTLSMRLSRTAVILLLVLFGLVGGVAVSLLVTSAIAGKKLQYFAALRRDNEYLKKDNEKLWLVYQKAERIDSLSRYLEKLAALSYQPGKNRIEIKKSAAKEAAADTAKKTKFPTVEKKNIVKENLKNGEKETVSEPTKEPIPSFLPVDGWITQHFSKDTSQGNAVHLGIDIAASEGMLIKAPAPGTVEAVEVDQYYGNLIVIKHDDEFTTRYGHCAKVFVTKGEKIERGQTVGLVGNTGYSTAPHLHYEVLRNGSNVNPEQYISQENK